MSVATETKTRIEIKPPSLWKVILLNDDYTPMSFVVLVLTQIFHKNEEEANRLMLTVHEAGQATVGLYTKEIATTKVLLTERAADTYGHPLKAICEEA